MAQPALLARAATQMAAADVYDFSSPSLFASGPAALPNPRQAKRPTVSLDAMVRKGRVGGFHDSELKEQLAAQVFSFSQEASNAMHHPLHGFTPETGNEPAVTPIPAATSFATTHRAQPPEPGATPGAAPALAPGAPAPTPEAMPPPPAPSAQQKARAQKALPAVETPSAARLLRQRSAEEAAPAPAQAATAAVPGGLQWEDMGSSSEDDEPHVPVRVPVHDPQATKYSLDSMLEDVSSKVTICPAARVSLDAAGQDPFGW